VSATERGSRPGPLPRVVVVGGGIAGLAAAAALNRRAPGALRVTVLEGSSSVGGKLALLEVAGVTTDAGAESMLFRRPEGVALAQAAGLGEDIVHPARSGAAVWTRGRLRALPAGQLMGVPGDLRALAASQIVSARGLARIPLDHVLPRTRVTHDVSIGQYVAARLGREVVDRLVEPLLGGVYAGHADELSLDATLPQLAGAVRVQHSLLDAVAEALGPPPSGVPRPVFASLRGGLGRLPAAVADLLTADGVEVRTGATVRELRRSPGGWRLVVGATREPEVLFADAVILALPASPAGRLLHQVSPSAAHDLGSIDYASVGLVTFAFRSTDLAGRLAGTGFLVPPVDGKVIKAATYSSLKWGWLEQAAEDVTLVRTSVGRHREVADLQRDDADLAAVALDDLRAAARIEARPIELAVTRWGGALPQYSVGHLERVARIRRAVSELPALAVAGAAYDGVGVPACIGSGASAAALVLDALAERRQWSHG
jgi:protoporphyrinogen/coproporphyrinogen III oxidase